VTVNSVRKAVEVLIVVAEEEAPVTLSQVSHKTGLPLATAKRILDTLSGVNLVRKEGKRYSLGLLAFEIGKRAERAMDLPVLAKPYLEKLREETGENANLAILQGSDVVYLACAESFKMMRTFTVPGARVPAHATGVGKVLLSALSDEEIRRLYDGKPLTGFTPKTVTDIEVLLRQLEKAREQGFALDEGEREEGVVCVAASGTIPEK